MNVIEYDAATGERIERDFTPEELAQRAKDQAEAEAAAQAAADKEAAEQQALSLTLRVSATIAHAKSRLGFYRRDDRGDMYPGLTV
jgi:hypothetical protein